MTRRNRPRLLIVAGHDPSGAGIDADLAAASGLDVEVLPVITARTDQDDRRVRSIGAREPSEWLREALEHVAGGVSAIKFGLLPGAEHVQAACELLRAARRGVREDVPAVVDPVIRASSGGVFLDDAAVEVLRGELIAAGVVLTPNLAETAELACEPLGRLESSLAARLEAARILLALGAAAVVIKGGHGKEDPVRDLVLAHARAHAWVERPRIRGGSLRGSGCRFATRLAAALAEGRSMQDAAEDAGRFVAAEIARARGEVKRSPR